MAKVINLITGNDGKVKSLERALDGLDYTINKIQLDIIEPQLDDIKDIALFKAHQAFQLLKRPLIINDGGLVIPALNGFPGPYTKYISNTLQCSDLINLVHKKDRSCYLTQCLVYVDNQGKTYEFQDKVMGAISTEESFTINSRAWGIIWKIFIPNGASKPLSEINEKEYYDKIRPQAQTNSVWEDLRNFLLTKE